MTQCQCECNKQHAYNNEVASPMPVVGPRAIRMPIAKLSATEFDLRTETIPKDAIPKGVVYVKV